MYCILVNRENPYLPHEEEARVYRPVGGSSVFMEETAARALWALLRRVDKEGQIVPVSGYRSREEQKEIWEGCLAERGEEYTRKYVAPEGCSEHETGLAIDLGWTGDSRLFLDRIAPHFPYEGICQDFRRLAPEYGFIQRYPKGKEKITGIGHEPWHFRYVGQPHAKIITDLGLVLEEYVRLRKESGALTPEKSNGYCSNLGGGR
ncbi:MAG: D-alanyl-D-alanine carboxypeptidase family protein [Anaerovoracaceae bacterium]|jgi:D-alanyl-D-alanine dipeptidase/carboxypeptidase